MSFLTFLIEGKVDDFKRLFSNKFNAEKLSEITSASESLDNKNKYLIWMGKSLPADTSLNLIKDLRDKLDNFDKVGFNLDRKDIGQYKDIDDLYKSLEDYNNRQRREIKKINGADVIFEDDKYLVVCPTTHTASCEYGKGTTWCTANESPTQYNSHNSNGKLFYFLSKKLPSSDVNYKVALDYKYHGGTTYYDAQDASFNDGWLVGTKWLDYVLKQIKQYVNEKYPNEVQRSMDEEAAQDEEQRLRDIEWERRAEESRVRRSAEISATMSESNDRREENEWDIANLTSGDEGSYAWVLLDYICDKKDIRRKEIGDDAKLESLKQRLSVEEDLETEYEFEDRDTTDIHAEIESIEEEIEELENSIDVYCMIPQSYAHYDMTQFKVLHPDISFDEEYAVGTNDEVESSAYESVESLIDDIGVTGFNESFWKNHIDKDGLKEYFEEMFESDVNDNPDVYLDEDEDRELSSEQDEMITNLGLEIENLNEELDTLGDKLRLVKEGEGRRWVMTTLKNFEDNKENDLYIYKINNGKYYKKTINAELVEEMEEKISEIEDSISEKESEIEDIKNDPEGEWDQDKIDAAVEDRVSDAMYNIESSAEEWGINLEDYVDKDELIKDAINIDGIYHNISSYDGDGEEITFNNETYHIIRTN